MQMFWHFLYHYARAKYDIQLLEQLIWHIVEVVLLYIVARIVIRVTCRIAKRTIHSRAVKADERRKRTMASLFDNVIRYTIYFIYVLTILPIFGVHIAALLAGAGIAGLAIGFGAQSLIKDVLTGFFILFEDQYGVGDTVKINNFMGSVQTIGLRLTRIQAWTGEVEIIPNGQITTVTNYSHNNSMAVVDIRIAYATDIDEASTIIQHTMERLKEECEEIVGDIKVLGVQMLRESDIVIRATAECSPNNHYGVQRLAQKRIKEAFDAAGLQMPYPQQMLHIQQPTNG